MDLDNLTRISFWAVAVALLLLERIPSLRRADSPVQYRWLTNLGLMLLGGTVLSVVFPASITTVANAMDTGLVHELQLPLLAELVLVFLLLDFWRYWEHRLLHEVPLLWRAHLVHHSDTALDVTTAVRHHPLEAIITTFIAFILVFAFGFSIQALGFYLLIAMLSSLYTHANITVPEPIDRPLRRWLVTPAVHAIHHSNHQPQTDSNYGSVLTVWDRLFGTYTDPGKAVIPRFGLGYFRQSRDTALGPVLLQPFEYRYGGSYPERCNDAQTMMATEPALPLSSQWRQALLYGGIGLCLALLALWPTALDLASVWSRTEPYQYAWLVLPMFIYVVGWYHRDNILAMTPRPGYTGLPLIALAAALWVAAFVVDIKLGQHVALVLVLQGIALCTLGWNTYRSQLPVMLLLFLMIPCGDILLPLLRGLTVKWIEWFALLTGLPHSVEGYVIYIGEHRYIVIDLCAGLTFFTLASFLGYSFGLLMFRSLPKVVAMAVLGAALGVLTNAVRVCLIVGIDWLRGSQMDLAAHQDIQWLVLLMSLALLLFLASRLQHDTWTTASDRTRETPDWDAGRYGPALAGALMLATVGLVQGLAYRSENSAVTSADSLQQLANHYPGSRWLETENAESRSLSIPFTKTMEVVLITPVSDTGRLIKSSLHPEDNERIWRHTDTGRHRDCLGYSCITFVHTTWKRKGSNDARHIFYTYYVGDLVTDSKLTFRLARGWNRLTGSPGSVGLIGFRLLNDIPPEFILISAVQELRADLHATVSSALASNVR